MEGKFRNQLLHKKKFFEGNFFIKLGKYLIEFIISVKVRAIKLALWQRLLVY